MSLHRYKRVWTPYNGSETYMQYARFVTKHDNEEWTKPGELQTSIFYCKKHMTCIHCFPRNVIVIEPPYISKTWVRDTPRGWTLDSSQIMWFKEESTSKLATCLSWLQWPKHYEMLNLDLVHESTWRFWGQINLFKIRDVFWIQTVTLGARYLSLTLH